jgi:Holliday junction resolvasome RuvABC endonuclease subunit
MSWSRLFKELVHETWRSALIHTTWISIEAKQCIVGAAAARVPQLQSGVQQCLGRGADLSALQGDDGLAQRLSGQHEQLRSVRRTVGAEGQFLTERDGNAESEKATSWP